MEVQTYFALINDTVYTCRAASSGSAFDVFARNGLNPLQLTKTGGSRPLERVVDYKNNKRVYTEFTQLS